MQIKNANGIHYNNCVKFEQTIDSIIEKCGYHEDQDGLSFCLIFSDSSTYKGIFIEISEIKIIIESQVLIGKH